MNSTVVPDVLNKYKTALKDIEEQLKSSKETREKEHYTLLATIAELTEKENNIKKELETLSCRGMDWGLERMVREDLKLKTQKLTILRDNSMSISALKGIDPPHLTNNKYIELEKIVKSPEKVLED